MRISRGFHVYSKIIYPRLKRFLLKKALLIIAVGLSEGNPPAE